MKSNNTYFNILASFAYLQTQKPFLQKIIEASNNEEANIMIDSGAFTLFNAKQKREWLTLDNYCKFLDVYGHQVEKYVMLDVIGNDEQSKENYLEMIRRDLNPMFVVTMADEEFSFVRDAVKNNEHICVAGGVTSKGEWMTKRFQDIYKETQAKIHGLGYVTYPKMYQLPLQSVDSSSWLQRSLVYGQLSYWDNGMKSISYMDVLKKKKKLPIQIIKEMELGKITPKQFSDLDNHKGFGSIAQYLSIIATIQYQIYSKQNDLNLFLAVANAKQFDQLHGVNEMMKAGTLTYQKFRNL